MSSGQAQTFFYIYQLQISSIPNQMVITSKTPQHISVEVAQDTNLTNFSAGC